MRNWLSKVSHQSQLLLIPIVFFCINKFYIDHVYVEFIKFISLMIESINLML